jgi:4-hydroxyphenylpyruvate dioxygenase
VAAGRDQPDRQLRTAQPAAYFAAEHGPSACGMGFRVKDAPRPMPKAGERGAEPVETQTGPMELRLPAIRGIGGAIIYLIDRYEATAICRSTTSISPICRASIAIRSARGFTTIDHLTHNVYGGRMAYWARYYERIFNFREIRYFDIKGEYTGLTSRAMTAPDGKIRIPSMRKARRGAARSRNSCAL